MSKDIQTLFKYLLDKANPSWQFNETLMEAFDNLNAPTSKRFEPPALHEVAMELKRQNVRHPNLQADKFWNFYESKNWMIGKNKMKNWKAAIKTWNFEKDNIIL